MISKPATTSNFKMNTFLLLPLKPTQINKNQNHKPHFEFLKIKTK